MISRGFLGRAAMLATLLALGFPVFAVAAPIRLILTSMSPPGSENSIWLNEWAKKVDADSHGTLHIEVKDGIALANFVNVYDRTLSDVVQIGYSVQQVIGGKFPLSAVTSLPFGFKSSEVGAVAYWRLYKTGMLNAEYKDIHPLFLWPYTPHNLNFHRKPANNMTDLSGLKIGAAGRVQSDVLSRMGATPISTQAGAYYEGLQRDNFAGGAFAWSAFAPYKLDEVTRYHVEGTPLGANTGMFFMAKAKFDSLPDAARKAIDDNAAETGSRAWGISMDKQDAEQRVRVAAEPGQVIVQLTPAQKNVWETKGARPVIADWIAQHPNGRQLVDTYRKLYMQAAAELHKAP